MLQSTIKASSLRWCPFFFFVCFVANPTTDPRSYRHQVAATSSMDALLPANLSFPFLVFPFLSLASRLPSPAPLLLELSNIPLRNTYQVGYVATDEGDSCRKRVRGGTGDKWCVRTSSPRVLLLLVRCTIPHDIPTHPKQRVNKPMKSSLENEDAGFIIEILRAREKQTVKKK